MKSTTIPTNFKVPKGFRHRWALYGSTGELIQELEGIPNRRKIRYIQHPISDECAKTTCAGLGLDWMAISVSHMRLLCEGDADIEAG